MPAFCEATSMGLIVSAFLVALAFASSSEHLVTLETKTPLDSRLANVHLTYTTPVSEELLFTYGPCHATNPRNAHHDVGRCPGSHKDRLVWIIPEDAQSGGCVSAWKSKESVLIGRSAPVRFDKFGRRWARIQKRQGPSIPMNNASGIDAEGPWFDGVELLKGKNLSAVSVEEAKSKSLLDSSTISSDCLLTSSWRDCHHRSWHVWTNDLCRSKFRFYQSKSAVNVLKA